MRNYMHKALLAAVVLSLLSAVAAAPVAEAGEVEPTISGGGLSLVVMTHVVGEPSPGTVVQVGMLPNADIAVNLAPILAKELTIRGAFRFSTEIDDAIAMLAESDALDSVISHVIPAASAVEAFAVARDSSASAKVLLSL